VYSTLLWHLQRNIELSFLAQELLGINPQSAQAWIAVGNLFSLQKERSQALTCFRRAAQMDPMCAYAFTLSGHESIDEDLDRAISFFQSALRADPRHYNAWYECTLVIRSYLLISYDRQVRVGNLLSEDEQNPAGRIPLPEGGRNPS
jgi:tetratricopeptide (TPR) repeat protein